MEFKYCIGDILVGANGTNAIGEVVKISLEITESNSRILYTVYGNGQTELILEENALLLVYKADVLQMREK